MLIVPKHHKNTGPIETFEQDLGGCEVPPSRGDWAATARDVTHNERLGAVNIFDMREKSTNEMITYLMRRRRGTTRTCR